MSDLRDAGDVVNVPELVVDVVDHDERWIPPGLTPDVLDFLGGSVGSDEVLLREPDLLHHAASPFDGKELRVVGER